jgi:hypothetical protein
MTVHGDDAIADDLGAPRKIAGQRDDDGLVDGPHARIVARRTGGIEQFDRRRGDRLVEV